MTTNGGRKPSFCAAFVLLVASVVLGFPVADVAVAVTPRLARSTRGFDPPPPITWIDGTRGFAVTSRLPGDVELLVVDRSGRSVEPTEFPQRIPIPSVAERTTVVRLLFDAPLDGDVSLQPRPALIYGFYRFEGSILGCQDHYPGAVTVCIGFSQADPGSLFDPTLLERIFADIPNMAREVSTVLDVVLSRPDVFVPIDRSRIVYSGFSIGAMAGYALTHPSLRDPRIRAIAARSGFAPDWVPAYSEPAVWETAPRLLMVNVHRDAVTPYDNARRVFRVARPFGRVTLVTVGGSDHSVSCVAAQEYERAWVQARLGLDVDMRLARDRVVTERCARFGLRRGGSEGDGRFDFLRP